MFSLHIDTARTWRGGQSQVRYTVLGCARIGHRAALVAASRGRAAAADVARASTSFRWRRASEIDLAAAWRLSRVLKQLRPDVVHAHDPSAVAMAATALSIAAPRPSRRSSRRGASSSPIGAQLVLALEVLAGRLLHRQQRRRPRSAGRRRHPASEDRRSCTRASTSSASSRMPAATCTPRSSCRRTRRSSATSARSFAHKGQHHLIDAAALVVREVPDVALRDRRRRRAARRAREADQAPAPRAPRVPRRLPRRRARAHRRASTSSRSARARGHVHGAESTRWRHRSRRWRPPPAAFRR